MHRRKIIDAATVTLVVLRSYIDACREILLKSVNDGKKVEPTHELIAPPSNKKKDPWGYFADQLASWTAEMSGRLDAGETALFATMLKYQLAEYLRTLYPTAMVRSWGFHVNRDIPPGAKTVSSSRLEVIGRMQLASSLSNDAPLTTLKAERDSWDPAEFIGAVEWSLSQLEAAAFSGFPLEMESVDGLALVAEQNFESVAAIGEAEAAIFGLLNEPNIPLISTVTGDWATATAEQILEDCQEILYGVRANVRGISQLHPTLLAVPENRWRYLNKRQAESNDPVRKSLKEEFPNLRIEPWTMSEEANATGDGPRLLACSSTKQVSSIFEPLPFQLLAPQQQGVKFRAFGRQKLGGVGIHHPMALAHMDGT